MHWHLSLVIGPLSVVISAAHISLANMSKSKLHARSARDDSAQHTDFVSDDSEHTVLLALLAMIVSTLCIPSVRPTGWLCWAGRDLGRIRLDSKSELANAWC